MKIFVFGSNNGEGIIIQIENWLCVIDSFEVDSKCPVLDFLNQNFPDKQIDLLVITHPHMDHYSGVESIANSKRTILVTLPFNSAGIQYQDFVTKIAIDTYKDDEISKKLIDKEKTPLGKFLNALRKLKANRNSTYTSAARTLTGGSLITKNLPSGKLLSVKVAAPFEHLFEDAIEKVRKKLHKGEFSLSTICSTNQTQNLYSTVLDFRYDGKRFLFFADATNSMMKEYIDKELGSEAIDFIKVAHHGSKEGGLKDFWNKISQQKLPCYAVITNHHVHSLPDEGVKKIIKTAVEQTGGRMEVVPISTVRHSYIEIDFNGSTPSFNYYQI